RCFLRRHGADFPGAGPGGTEPGLLWHRHPNRRAFAGLGAGLLALPAGAAGAADDGAPHGRPWLRCAGRAGPLYRVAVRRRCAALPGWLLRGEPHGLWADPCVEQSCLSCLALAEPAATALDRRAFVRHLSLPLADSAADLARYDR